MGARPKIAIIGAGLSGALAAYHLSSIADVVVFEKSRGVGGRLARAAIDGRSFNLGAQVIPDHPIIPQDLLLSPVHGLWLSYPINQAIHLLLDKGSIQVETNTLVRDVSIHENEVLIETSDKTNTFNHVVFAMPAIQAKKLCHKIIPNLDCDRVEYQSVVTVFLTALSLKLKEEAYEISWIDGLWRALVLINTQEYFDIDEVSREKLFEKKYEVKLKKIHFWRYGFVKTKKELNQKFFNENKIAFVGDWVTSGPGFYGVFESVQFCVEKFYELYSINS